ncbi:F-box domain containing protein [Tanacetum coccineum]
MGNYASSCNLMMLPRIKTNKAARVIFPSGEIRQYKEPVKAAEIMFECPNFFLVNSQSLNINRRFSPLSADEELEYGNIYIMFPMRRLNSMVTHADMAVFWMAANSAAKRISGKSEGGDHATVMAKDEAHEQRSMVVVELPEFSHRPTPVETCILLVMADFLPDDIVRNILAWLPAKPLVRFQCVSKHWNRMLTEPNFMNFRSRKSIILPLSEALHLIDHNVPTDDMPHSILKRCYPYKKRDKYSSVRVIGTFNGIVLLRLRSRSLILYNPFTGAFKKLPGPPYRDCRRPGYGFGHGATPDDLKIVRFKQESDICDVYSFKKSLWSTKTYNMKRIKFEHCVGTFANGFLHWVAYNNRQLLIILKDMVLSEMHLPFSKSTIRAHLGTIDGCLCSLNKDNADRFELWVLEEHGGEKSWLPKYSFTCKPYHISVCILASGRILMKSPSELIIYDCLENTYEKLNISSDYKYQNKMYAVEYVESLVSPSDICFSENGKRNIYDGFFMAANSVAKQISGKSVGGRCDIDAEIVVVTAYNHDLWF